MSISLPTTLTQCQNATIKWSGPSGLDKMIEVFVKGTNYFAESWGQASDFSGASGSITWLVDIAAGAEVAIEIRNTNGSLWSTSPYHTIAAVGHGEHGGARFFAAKRFSEFVHVSINNVLNQHQHRLSHDDASLQCDNDVGRRTNLYLFLQIRLSRWRHANAQRPPSTGTWVYSPPSVLLDDSTSIAPRMSEQQQPRGGSYPPTMATMPLPTSMSMRGYSGVAEIIVDPFAGGPPLDGGSRGSSQQQQQQPGFEQFRSESAQQQFRGIAEVMEDTSSRGHEGPSGRFGSPGYPHWG
ncbi:hypothetical protein MNV49_002331 [Pseudohyphozyma bogoriensis]|nr:hypothetical protein MNV49_002331 [Pseudohyphozyma bogoriensis]